MYLNTTLGYVEQDGNYLMLHRVKKENDLNHDKWIGSAENSRTGKARRNVCAGRHWRKRG